MPATSGSGPVSRAWSLGVITALAMGSATPRVAFASAPEVTAADVDTDRRARGMTLYEEGNAKYDAGEYVAAIESFTAAFDLLGDPLLLYNLAICYDRTERYEDALAHFRRYRAVAPANEYAELDRKIASVETRRDASASRVAEDQTSEPPRPMPPSSDAGVVSSDDRKDTRIVTPIAWGLGGASIVMLGVGTGLAVAASQRNDDADASCVQLPDGRLCDKDGDASLRVGRSLGIATIASFAVGGALAIAALAVVAANASRRRKAGRDVGEARLLPHGLGLTARF